MKQSDKEGACGWSPYKKTYLIMKWPENRLQDWNNISFGGEVTNSK